MKLNGKSRVKKLNLLSLTGDLVFVVLSVCGACAADVALPSIFSEGMVLQRQMKVPVWGWGSDGESVSVEVQGHKASTVVRDGVWRVDLPALKAGGPLTMTIRASNTIEIKDVLVGEVWFTCGQSNMMMSLAKSTGGMAFFKNNAPLPKGRIRVINEMGRHLHSRDKVKDDVPARWMQPTVGHSAISSYFAHKLYQHFDGQVPVGIVTYVEIVPAEAWVDHQRIANDPKLRHILKHPLQASSKTYNGVIAPISPYAVRGVLYYQGEYNGARGLEFRHLMPALIESWRQAWQRPELPFLFVQLPGFISQEAPPTGIDMDAETLALYKKRQRETWTVIRQSQLLTWQNTPNTGMAVTIDLGAAYDIHPPNKEPVADRLLLMARKIAYGQDLIYSGPVPKNVEADKGALVVTFNHIGSGLMARGDKLLGFEVAGRDELYQSAKAVIVHDSVVVSSRKVQHPVHLRYAWAGLPTCTLYNKENLPATPFRYSVGQTPLSSHAPTRANPRHKPKVFAHYMVCYATYSEAAGVDGYKQEIAEAQAAGIDGFALNVGAWSKEKYYQRRTEMIFRAAKEAATDFKLFFSIDHGNSEDIKDMIRRFAKHPNYLHRDGKVVVSTFSHSHLSWRQKIFDPLAAEGIGIFFVPYFYPRPNVTELPDYNAVMQVYRKHQSLVDGLFYFGAAGTPDQLARSNTAYARAMADVGKLCMASYTPSYWGHRQPGRRYYEMSGGQGLETQWRAIIDSKPDWVEIVTWNDFNESSWISPVDDPGKYFKELKDLTRHSHAGHLELSKYYIRWYKEGKVPPIERDGLFYFYRTHPRAVKATTEDKPVTQTHGDVEDIIYLTTLLIAPAEVVIHTGSQTVTRRMPAGLAHTKVQFAPGKQRFELRRTGRTLAETTGPLIRTEIERYNFFPASGFVYAPRLSPCK